MIGALWTGISGLSSQQQALDNESNNIANVNTVGFKASRISFADQMYQDRIGKGSKILDAEKLYTQGNLKLTGVSYDMALSGEGFFVVADTRASGTAENYYTRAGNFRMGDNGTLQDAAGNEVQGWMMTPIDSMIDVTSTNPNVDVFTNDYSKLLSSKIVKHSTYVETITAKSTDYTQTATNDSEAVFSGAGMKSKSGKISDIEEAIKDYSMWLQRLKETPDGSSATSTAQVSQLNFKTGAEGVISKEGDQIYVYINGNKISQNYLSVTHTQEFEDAIIAAPYPDPSTGGTGGGAWTDADWDREASRVATYKALADKISEIPGLVAYMSSEAGGANNDVLENEDSFALSTKAEDMYKGIIQIESLIPGQEFTISEVASVSGSTISQGNSLTSQFAQAGTGIGALESSKEALSKLITGKQQDVYSATDLGISDTPSFTYSINIYDKELGANIPVPNDNGTPPLPVSITVANATSIDDFIDKFKAAAAGGTPNLLDYVEPLNLNGHLVIQTKDTNFDVEFSGGLKTHESFAYSGAGTANHAYDVSPTPPDGEGLIFSYIDDPAEASNLSWTTIGPANSLVDLKTLIDDIPGGLYSASITAGEITVTGPTTGTEPFQSDISLATGVPKDTNSNLSGRQGAGAEFIEIVNKVDQTTSKGSLQLRLDTLGISDSAFGEFAVDNTGLITMKQDGAEFAIGQVAIALFNNNRGLEPRGDNLLEKTNDSGEPIFNLNNDKAANVESKTLELSTADLSESLVNLMVFQRAFEANAKSITTSDQLLNTLINLKR